MKRKAPLALALMHYPTKDRLGNRVATNITNFDIHDIARACRVFGVDQYFIIHPLPEQLMFVERVLDHWRVGEGSKFNPMRKTALTVVKTAKDLDHAMSIWGVGSAKIIATHAKNPDPSQKKYNFSEFKSVLAEDDQPYILTFGTGFGLTQDFLQSCYGVLEPIKGASADDYRHLSVRSAVSICLDRLLGS